MSVDSEPDLGSDHAEAGFYYAFVKGADFIYKGMYDLQSVDDVDITVALLVKKLKCPREWFA